MCTRTRQIAYCDLPCPKHLQELQSLLEPMLHKCIRYLDRCKERRFFLSNVLMLKSRFAVLFAILEYLRVRLQIKYTPRDLLLHFFQILVHAHKKDIVRMIRALKRQMDISKDLHTRYRVPFSHEREEKIRIDMERLQEDGNMIQIPPDFDMDDAESKMALEQKISDKMNS